MQGYRLAFGRLSVLTQQVFPLYACILAAQSFPCVYVEGLTVLDNMEVEIAHYLFEHCVLHPYVVFLVAEEEKFRD